MLVAIVAPLSCRQLVGQPDRFLREAPASSEIIGEWRVSNLDTEELAGLNAYVALPERAPRLLVAPTGCQLEEAAGHPIARETTCTWRLGQAVAYARHAKVDAHTLELRFERDHTIRALSLFFHRDSRGLLLWTWEDDPGSQRYVELRRVGG